MSQKRLLIVKPSFDQGNVGDLALLKSIQHLYNGQTLYIPNSKNDLHNCNVDEYDSLIYFGNDCVPYYGGCIPVDKIKQFLSCNKKVHIINASWGNNAHNNCVKILKSIANHPKLYIYMRDEYSHELIQRHISFRNSPVLTADLAFLCKQKTSTNDNNLEKWINKDNKSIIGINTHHDFKEFNSIIRDELKRFMIKNKDEYRYLFIPHDSRKREYEDLKLLCSSCNGIDGFTTNYLDPEYEKYITSSLYLVITGRMHLSILTIPNNVPCIAISYNGIKARGSFKHFGLEDFILEPKDMMTLSKIVDDIKDNYGHLQSKIESNKKKVETLIHQFLHKILE